MSAFPHHAAPPPVFARLVGWGVIVAVALSLAGTGIPARAAADEPSPAASAGSGEVAPSELDSAELDAGEFAALVAQLGADSFRVRESAMARLLTAGPAALPALRAADVESDPELRQRVAIIIQKLATEDFETRVAAFLSGGPEARMPGWNYAAQKLGDRAEMREVFVEISRRHPDFVSALEGSIEERQVALSQLTGDVLAMSLDFQNQPTIPDAFAVLLLATDPEVPASESTDAVMLRLVRRYEIASAFSDSQLKEAFRKLLGQWIVRASRSRRIDVLSFALQWDLHEALTLAAQTLQDSTEDVEKVEWALRTIARFGTPADAPLVQPLLDDARPAGNGYAFRDPAGRPLEVQIRDVAMATVAELNDRSLRDVGFPIAESEPSAQLDIDMLGFPEGEAGAEARQRVRSEIDELIAAAQESDEPEKK